MYATGVGHDVCSVLSRVPPLFIRYALLKRQQAFLYVDNLMAKGLIACGAIKCLQRCVMGLHAIPFYTLGHNKPKNIDRVPQHRQAYATFIGEGKHCGKPRSCALRVWCDNGKIFMDLHTT
jgi:hypothetical protein